MEWRVELEGDKFDLEEIQRQLVGGEHLVVEEEGRFYLKSPAFVDLKDSTEVREKAEEIVELLNGVAKLTIGLMKPITINSVVRIRDDGKKDLFVTVSNSITIRYKILSPNSSSPEKTNAQRFLELAEKDEKVAQTFKIINKNPKMDYYPLLYNLFEIVQDDLGSKITEMRWTSKKEIGRFCRTACSPKILGLEARHAIQKHLPPKKPMFLPEARRFIRELLLKWLEYKWEQYKSGYWNQGRVK
jgi:hypothetical protein